MLPLNLKFNVNICNWSHFYSYYLAIFHLQFNFKNHPLVNLTQTKGETANGDVTHLGFGSIQVKARCGKYKGQFTYICPLKSSSKYLCFALKVLFQLKFLLVLTHTKKV